MPTKKLIVGRKPVRVATHEKKKKRKSKPAAVTSVPVRPVARARGIISSYSEGGKADARAFAVAISNPLSPQAIGCRVADAYSMPTATYHVRTSIVATANAQGIFSAAILPSPCYSLHLNAGLITGLTAFTQNTSAAYLLSPTAVSTVLSEYRTVSWGIRLLAKDTAFNTKGKIFIAPIPTTENAPSWNTLETVTGTGAGIGEYTYGIDPAYVGTGINGLPGVRVFSMQDLLRGEIQCAGIPTNNSFYQFKGTTDRSNVNWNVGQVLADEGVFNSTTGLVNATAGGRKDIASLRGGRAFYIYATGLPASGQEFDIELVYHLEGTPNVSGSSGPVTLVPSAMRAAHGSTAMVEKALGIASTVGKVITFIRDPANQAAAMRAVGFLGL